MPDSAGGRESAREGEHDRSGGARRRRQGRGAARGVRQEQQGGLPIGITKADFDAAAAANRPAG
ncbi:MAG: hypothetical protein WDN24_22195 [Sphingomonas sp.]